MNGWSSQVRTASGLLDRSTALSAPGARITDVGRIFLIEHERGLSPERSFYVIWRQPSAGFFSIVSSILGHLRIAERIGATPVLDMRTFPNRYSDPETRHGGGWDCYFLPLSDTPIEMVHLAAKVLVVNGSHPNDTTMFMSEDPELGRLWRRYLHLSPEAEEFVAATCMESGVDSSTLAVHARGGDMRTATAHPLPPSTRQLLSLVDHAIEVHGFDSVLVCSDDPKSVATFRRRYGTRMRDVRYPAGRSAVQTGMRVLADAQLMAAAGGLIAGTSNVSEAAIMMRESETKYVARIWNGWNSSLPVAPRFAWYVRRALPVAVGGFAVPNCPSCRPSDAAGIRFER